MLSIEVTSGYRVSVGDELVVTFRRAKGRTWLNLEVSQGTLRLVESMPGLTLLEHVGSGHNLDAHGDAGVGSRES